MATPMVQTSSLTLVVIVENGELAPDVVAQIVDDDEDIALTPQGRDADGRMLFLAPDAGKALLLVRRYSFEASGGASFTFTLAAPAVRIVLPDGTDAASRDKVLGHVVTYLANKDAVEVSPATDDVFILTAESAPRIEELLRPAFPHRIKGVDVKFELALVRPPPSKVYAREANDPNRSCEAALVLGSRAVVLSRRPAARSPPHLALGTSASLRLWHSCSLRCPQQPLHHTSPPQQLSSNVPCTTWTPAAARGAFELQLHALRRAGRSMDPC